MKKILTALLGAALVCGVGAVRANVVTFDDPGLVEIDNDTGIATYTEAGFAFSGPAATFLPLDQALLGGIDGSAALTVQAVGGGAFSLTSLAETFYDLGFDAPPGTLTVAGLRNGVQVASSTFQLGSTAMPSFGAAFANLTAVTLLGTTGFSIDNFTAMPAVAAVPEPSTFALMALALAAGAVRVGRARRVRA